MSRVGLFALLMAVLQVPCGMAASFSIEPFKVQLVPARGKTSQVFRFSNPGNSPQAVKISVESWQQDAQGMEVNQPDETSFTVYPPQFVLQPRSEQRVRVSWQQPFPDVERAFRLVAEQLPVEFPQRGEADTQDDALRYLLVYRAAMYVTPPKARSQVDVRGYDAVTDADGRRWLVLNVVNQGKAHTLLKAPVVRVALADGRTHVLEGDAVDGLTGENLHAGAARSFKVAWPEATGGVIKAVSLDFTAGP